MPKGHEDFLDEEQEREIKNVSTNEQNYQHKLKIKKLREKKERGEELTKEEQLELNADNAVPDDEDEDEDEDYDEDL